MGFRGLTFWTLCLAVCISVGLARGPRKIVGGSEVAPGDLPHQVSLATTYNQFFIFCGGSIISETHILTAAHCIISQDSESSPITRKQESDIVVAMGMRLYGDRSAGMHFVDKISTHEGYARYPNFVNDIAVLKLNRPITINDYQRPIALATGDIGVGVGVIASGFGYIKSVYNKEITAEHDTKTLQRLDMETVESGDSRLIRVKGASGTGICMGDSGGPLTYRVEGQEDQVIGVASYVNINTETITGFQFNQTCATQFPDTFTSVHAFSSWINGHMKVADNDYYPKFFNAGHDLHDSLYFM